MNFFHVLILSIVEGITEFLPVSSTAHLYIVEHVLNISITPYIASFTIIIQVGALIGTALYMYKHLSNFEINLKKIFLACIPTLLIGFLFYKLFKYFLIGNMVVIGWALIIGSLFMFYASYTLEKNRNKKQIIKNKNAVLLGIIQALSIIPGVSRSGAVLVGGYFFGFEKDLITRFSFLIGLPVAYSAALYDMYKTPVSFSYQQVVELLIGIVLSGIIAYFIAGFFLKYIKKINLSYFALYRIVLGILVLLFLV